MRSAGTRRVTALVAALVATLASARPGPAAAEDREARSHTVAVATRAFEAFRHGLERGEWQGFFDLLADDFSFYFPTGRWQGQHRGKDKAIEFFRYVSQVFPDGLRVSLDRVTANEATVVFEFRDEGTLAVPGEAPRPYKNRVAVSLDVCGEKICQYREYVGSDGRSN
jgi:ketosteroid isomerase-like protein